MSNNFLEFKNYAVFYSVYGVRCTSNLEMIPQLSRLYSTSGSNKLIPNPFRHIRGEGQSFHQNYFAAKNIES